MATPVICNVNTWLDENAKFFLPPVSNKLMHKSQLNVMFVGGPNKRNDYHIEGGEELFFQLKGDMILKVVEKNRHKNVVIKEGEIFLLPRAIPHSPQRFADTVGLVIERSRTKTEIDGIRYYVSEGGVPTTTPLYEAWFEWDQNRDRMSEFFDIFYNSEQYRTGRPIPGTIPENSPTEVDSETTLENPFSLSEWIEENMHTINNNGRLELFDTTSHQIQVYIYGAGDNTDCLLDAETWIWQVRGESTVNVGSKDYKLEKDDSILLPAGQRFCVRQEQGSLALVCSQVHYQPNERGQHVTPSHS